MTDPRWPLAELVRDDAGACRDGEAAGVVFAERRPRSIVEFCCWPDRRQALGEAAATVPGFATLPDRGSPVVRSSTCILLQSPGRFLAISSQPGLSELLATAISPEIGAVVDLSHARAGLRISGPNAHDLLQTALAFDLADDAFPPVAAAQGAIHGMSATVIRLDAETFDLFVFRGFAGSLWSWATRSATQFGWRTSAAVG